LVSGSGDSSVRVWDIDRCQNTQTLNGHEFEVYTTKLDEKYRIISGGQDKLLRLWDLRSGECMQTIQHEFPIFDCEISENLVFTACGDNLIRAFDLRMGGILQMYRVHTEAIHALRLNGNCLASGGTDKTAKLIVFNQK